MQDLQPNSNIFLSKSKNQTPMDLKNKLEVTKNKSNHMNSLAQKQHKK